ncbi:tRNA (N6-threonylcarbamoyladenosine(37)-N6)-methyltransferase TrmO [Hornefia butyriciproducens]|uniref:tRNA (N6-threonylcarbamoyladenosine(37)-N6)-methyltransferase TrmO n=1 Tax=Hornefia butyriciproducens TaxID=2652293 RepID=UPI003F8A5296
MDRTNEHSITYDGSHDMIDSSRSGSGHDMIDSNSRNGSGHDMNDNNSTHDVGQGKNDSSTYDEREELTELTLKPVAYIKSDFHEKFGIPRQSGLASELTATVVFTPEFRSPEAVRGLSEYSYLWLIWGFHANFPRKNGKTWSPTVRPPRLGGNTRVGVFATRSPNRPNPIGLSSVRIRSVDASAGRILVSGADLLDGTPIYDLKPYVPYADSHPDAAGGFTDRIEYKKLSVEFPPELLNRVRPERQKGLIQVLEQDPRDAYEKKPEHVYGMIFGGQDIRFTVRGSCLTVVDVADRGNHRVKRRPAAHHEK